MPNEMDSTTKCKHRGALEADNAAMREALDPFCGRRNSEGYDPNDPACSVRCISAWRCKALALTPDSGKEEQDEDVEG